ncbi:MAG: amidase family protein [Ilumatobacteraceae bacterium]
MSAGDPTLWPAVEQARAIAERRLGSEELLDLMLARIEAVGPRVNAVCTIEPELARAEARRADEAAVRGDRLGPLHGLPMTVKDAIATTGIRSTGGAVALRDHVPRVDAEAVTRLRAAGAVVFGKTNLPEWSGDWQSFNEMFGTTSNPWDAGRTPGGSSGGAAAAVATGMTSVELGTDIGGSVRVPSAFCGVFGHKPSFGIIPTLGYLDEPLGGDVESDVNTFGPIARSADDLAVMLDVLAGPCAADAVAWRLDLPQAMPSSLRGLRVGAWIDDSLVPIDGEMAEVLRDAVDALRADGAVITDLAGPAVDLQRAWRTAVRLIGSAVSVSDAEDRGPSHRSWLFLDRERASLRAAWAAVFDHVDVVICPVTSTVAFPHLQEGYWGDRMVRIGSVERPYLELEAWPAIVGAAYLPSTAVPVGFTRGGLPVGAQVVGPYLHDYRTIAVARLVGDVVGGYAVPPL